MAKASKQISDRTKESRAILIAAASFIVSILIGLFYFWGKVSPIFGQQSIGDMASILAAVSALVGFWYGYESPLTGDKHRLRRWSTTIALAFVHGAISLLLSVVVFFLAQDAFKGLALDQWVSAFLVGMTAALCGYVAYLVGTSLNSMRVSVSLAAFLVIGVMASMVTSKNPYWWQMHFSSLGGGGTASAKVFNLTLILAGLVVVGLSDFLHSDFQRLQQKGHQSDAKVGIICLLLALIGVFLAFVGLFPYDTHSAIHGFSASAMAVLFLGLISALPWLAHSFTKAFFVLSYAMLAAMLACYWLYGTNYFNLTAFELSCAAIIFTWLVVFVRNLAAETAALTAK